MHMLDTPISLSKDSILDTPRRENSDRICQPNSFEHVATTTPWPEALTGVHAYSAGRACERGSLFHAAHCGWPH